MNLTMILAAAMDNISLERFPERSGNPNKQLFSLQLAPLTLKHVL